MDTHSVKNLITKLSKTPAILSTLNVTDTTQLKTRVMHALSQNPTHDMKDKMGQLKAPDHSTQTVELDEHKKVKNP